MIKIGPNSRLLNTENASRNCFPSIVERDRNAFAGNSRAGGNVRSVPTPGKRQSRSFQIAYLSRESSRRSKASAHQRVSGGLSIL